MLIDKPSDCELSQQTQKNAAAFNATTLSNDCLVLLEKQKLGNVDIDSTTFLIECDFAVHECEQRVVVTLTDISSGTPLSATLANQDVACGNSFATELFHAASLCVGVSTVAARALSFLMCHYIT